MRRWLHVNQLDIPGADRRALDQQFHRRVAHLASPVRAMADADQPVAVVAGPSQCPGVRGLQGLDDPVARSFDRHGVVRG